MVSYGLTRDVNNNNNIPMTYHKYINNDDDNSEIEFEGWLQLGGNKSMERNLINKCPRSQSIIVNSNKQFIPEMTNCCCQSDYIHLNFNDLQQNCRGYCMNQRLKNRNHCNFKCHNRNDVTDDILYVNNKQQPPTVLLQKPHTVVVRNKSRPPIVVQQPPPNVIVKNDPPQPVYIQNYPPNVMIKNDEYNRMNKAHGLQCNCNSRNQMNHPIRTLCKHEFN